MASSGDQHAWVERVLGVRIDPPGGAADTGTPKPDPRTDVPAGTVAYRKLLLRWREAQAALNADIQSLGATLLAHPAVKRDPRLPAVQKAVGELPGLIPRFSGALEDALDAGISEADPAQLPKHAAAGAAAVDSYLSALAGAKQLRALEAFAATHLGQTSKLAGALTEALADLKRQIAA